MAWTPVTTAMVVYLGDPDDADILPIVPGSLTISGNMQDLCRVASFSLAGQPDPRPQRSNSIVIRYLDFDAELQFDVFGGRLQRPDTESDPWGQVHVASDTLEKTRRTKRGGDMALSGSGRTEGDAYKLILDYCDIDYDPADIADSGYVIGLEEALKWHDDGSTSAAAMLTDFDRVFGMKLMTIGNNRVVRIPYDPTPDDDTGVYRTFTKGTNVDWGKHHRGGGTRDDVVNVWKVTGASIQINDACTATTWADAYDSVTELGPNVRPADGTFQSDLIQSEDLAEAIARRQMRMFNRVAEIGSGTIVGDPNIYPCTKIKLHDTTYGIGANPRYATITSYSWTFPSLSFEFVAGPAGDEGSVTHGVDKICNDDHSDIDIPGDGFDFPTFDFPPIDAGDALDFTPPDSSTHWPATGDLDVRAIPPGGSFPDPLTVRLVPTFPCIIYYTDDGSTPTTGSTMYTGDLTISTTTTLKFFGREDAEHVSAIRTEVYTIGGGGGGGEDGFDVCLDLLGGAFAAEWVEDNNPWGPPEAGTLVFDGSTADADVASPAFPFTGWGVAATVRTGVASTEKYWRIVVAGTVDTITGAMVSVSLIDDTGGALYVQKAVAYFSGIGSTYTDQWFIDDAFALGNDFGSHDIGLGFRIVLERHDWYMTVRLQNGAGDDLQTDSLLTGWDSEATGDDLAAELVVFTDDMGGQLTITGYQLCAGAAGAAVSPADWTALVGSPSITGDDAVHFTDESDEDAYAGGHVFDGTERCRVTGHMDFDASDEVILHAVLGDAEGAASGNFAGIEIILGASPAFNVYTWDGFVTDLGTDLSGLAAGCDVALDFDTASGVFSFVVVDSATFATLASGAYPLGTWPGDMTVHLDHGSGVAVDWDVTGLVVRSG